jgi:hypothetical protein
MSKRCRTLSEVSTSVLLDFPCCSWPEFCNKANFTSASSINLIVERLGE